jgi:hypothetical protein
MRSVVAILAVAGSAAAFSPVAQPMARTTSLNAEGYDGLVGISLETGKKFVSALSGINISSYNSLEASL